MTDPLSFRQLLSHWNKINGDEESIDVKRPLCAHHFVTTLRAIFHSHIGAGRHGRVRSRSVASRRANKTNLSLGGPDGHWAASLITLAQSGHYDWTNLSSN